MTAKSTVYPTAGKPVVPPDEEERAERLGQQARWLMVAYVSLMGGALWFFHAQISCYLSTSYPDPG